VIASAASTPVGSLNGVFANVPAHDLGAEAIKAVFPHAKVTTEVLAGHAIQADNAIKSYA
jgi:acetyl-CoA C-acetyltransferase